MAVPLKSSFAGPKAHSGRTLTVALTAGSELEGVGRHDAAWMHAESRGSSLSANCTSGVPAPTLYARVLSGLRAIGSWR